MEATTTTTIPGGGGEKVRIRKSAIKEEEKRLTFGRVASVPRKKRVLVLVGEEGQRAVGRVEEASAHTYATRSKVKRSCSSFNFIIQTLALKNPNIYLKLKCIQKLLKMR
jgi:hypothetical protein